MNTTEPYPEKYKALWKLRNGQTVLLRPVKPEDEPMWLEMFSGWSEETIRYRFFGTIKVPLTHEFSVSCTNIDYDREIAIVAELEEDGKRKLLGVVRLFVEPVKKTGEIAFVVADAWHRQGLGSKLVNYIVEISKDKKLDAIQAVILRDNYKAIGLMKKIGFNLEFPDEDIVKATLNLKTENVPTIIQKEIGKLQISLTEENDKRVI
ncbi:MAG: GNAT family N-acetyltransferase [Candidatus Methanoperedens sp.]|nr:GNAT family N-acetyltransferase [Candidatus Methanoperedens sp.]